MRLFIAIQFSDDIKKGLISGPVLIPGFSISVFRIVVLIPRFDAVVLMAEWLPVALVPEELLVSSVRNDVVHVCCLDVLAFLHALYAQGVRLKVTLACPLPCLAIASACCRPRLLWVLQLVYLTVLLPVRNEESAARMTARRVGSMRHCFFLQ